MKLRAKLPEDLLKFLFWNLLYSVELIFVSLAVCSLFGVYSFNVDDAPTFGLKGFFAGLVLGPIFVVLFTLLYWIMLRIGNIILYIFFRNQAPLNEVNHLGKSRNIDLPRNTVHFVFWNVLSVNVFFSLVGAVIALFRGSPSSSMENQDYTGVHGFFIIISSGLVLGILSLIVLLALLFAGNILRNVFRIFFQFLF